MKRIGILTAGGDTPALNATIHGAVTRANQLKVEIIGLIKGFNCLFNPRVPHVHLNPLYQKFPNWIRRKAARSSARRAIMWTRNKKDDLDLVASRLKKLGIEGLICIGGDGTLNGLQPLAERLPTVLAPKTIDNDLGLNYPSEPDECVRVNDAAAKAGFRYKRAESHTQFRPEPDRELRHARLRHRRFCFRQRRRAHSHDGRKPPPHRHHRSHGPAFRLHRARLGLRPAGHYSGSGNRAGLGTARCAGEASLRSAKKCRHRLRRRHRGRTGPRTRRGNQIHRPGGQRRFERRVGSVAVETDPDDRRQIFSSFTAAANRPRRPSSRAKSATRSAADGRFYSTVFTRRRKAPRRLNFWWKAATTPFPFCNTARRRVFTSRATTRTVSATAGV